MSIDDRLARERLLPVVDGCPPAAVPDLVRGLSGAGLSVVEVTLRRPDALEVLTACVRADPDLAVGAGTVLTADQVDDVVAAGATFVVSPGLAPDVVDRCQRLGVPVMPGVSTPSEVMAALRAGCRTVKVFPTSALGGAGYVRALASVFPGLRFVPSGGIREADLADLLALDAVLAVAGSWFVAPDVVAAGADAVERAARAAAETARHARGDRP